MRAVNTAYLWCMETCFEKRQHWEQGRKINPKPLRKCVLVAQLCLTFCDPMNCSLPGSSVHGILQTRILEWVTIPFCRGSSHPRDRTGISCIVGRFFTFWATKEDCILSHSKITFVIYFFTCSLATEVHIFLIPAWNRKWRNGWICLFFSCRCLCI